MRKLAILALVALRLLVSPAPATSADLPQSNDPWAFHRSLAAAEGIWQAENLIDTIQSIHGAVEDQCYVEGDPIERPIVGAHPSAAGVVGVGLGFALAHYGISRWLLDHDHPKIAWAFQLVSIANTSYSIGHNYSVGIRIGQPNTDYAACPLWARP